MWLDFALKYPTLKFMHNKVHTEDIIKIEDLVLRNDYFECNSKFSQQISGITIDAKFTLPHVLAFL